MVLVDQLVELGDGVDRFTQVVGRCMHKQLQRRVGLLELVLAAPQPGLAVTQLGHRDSQAALAAGSGDELSIIAGTGRVHCWP